MTDYTKMIDTMMKMNDAQLVNYQKYVYESILKIRDHFLEDSSGDIVECGVWRGLTVTFLAKVFPENTIWACDSFKGCPTEASQMEFHNRLEVDLKTHKGLYSEPEEHLQSNLDLFEVDRSKFNIVRGYFKDTLPTLPIEKISVLRIDGDMYSSTMEVLVHLYPKVVPGGVVIFDDWVLPDSRAAIIDYFGGTDKMPPMYDSIHCKHVTKDFDNQPQGSFCVKPRE